MCKIMLTSCHSTENCSDAISEVCAAYPELCSGVFVVFIPLPDETRKVRPCWFHRLFGWRRSWWVSAQKNKLDGPEPLGTCHLISSLELVDMVGKIIHEEEMARSRPPRNNE